MSEPPTTQPPAGKPVPKNIKTIPQERAKMPEQPAAERARNFFEVNLGFSEASAHHEAARCIECKKPRCVPGCPVGIDIPGFIREIDRGDYRKAYEILKKDNALPAVCGRVCPQETQCEIQCVIGAKLEPVSIGRLERWISDWALQNKIGGATPAPPNGKRVAIVGSGPAGLTCAQDLALAGCKVTVFEALHCAGGVLQYGIPEFRLPKRIVNQEVAQLEALGVEIKLNSIVGRMVTIPQLISDHGFHAVFIGTGAGFPKFLGVPGEGYNGVLSSNEFLTRVNLMAGWKFPNDDTPVGAGKRVAVVGAGNTAMDAARCAKRLGSESWIVYRRTEKESPARVEEIHHAMEEGVIFKWLTAPVRIIGNEQGWVTGMECVEMELGEPDSSGRRRPVEKKGTNFVIPLDTVIAALGTSANPIIARTTPGLTTHRGGYIPVDEESGMANLPGVFAGGDIVTGGATVILAMGAGRRAARGILRYLGIETHEAASTPAAD